MANNINAGFPAYGTAAAQAANRAFTDEWKKKAEEETSRAVKKYAASDKETASNKASDKQAATYQKGTANANVESYDKTGKSTAYGKARAASSTAANDTDAASVPETQTNVTGTPTGQVSGFARAGAVLNHSDYGKVVGEPKLSEEGAKYYNELKKKFKGLDFVLVGRDSVQTAKQQQNSYANGNRLVVLIDEDKIEQMAKDPKFRNYYEGIIKQAQSGQFAQAQAQAKVAPKFNSGSEKKGPNVLDNGAKGFLAASAKANKEFAKKTAKMREKKKAEKRAEAKKEEKRVKEERRKERLEEGRKERKVQHSAEKRYTHEELAKRPERIGNHSLDEIRPGDNIPAEYQRKFEEMGRRISKGETPGSNEETRREGGFVDFRA